MSSGAPCMYVCNEDALKNVNNNNNKIPKETKSADTKRMIITHERITTWTKANNRIPGT